MLAYLCSQNLNRLHETMPEHQRRGDDEEMKDLVTRAVDGEAFEVLFRKLYDRLETGN